MRWAAMPRCARDRDQCGRSRVPIRAGRLRLRGAADRCRGMSYQRAYAAAAVDRHRPAPARAGRRSAPRRRPRDRAPGHGNGRCRRRPGRAARSRWPPGTAGGAFQALEFGPRGAILTAARKACSGPPAPAAHAQDGAAKQWPPVRRAERQHVAEHTGRAHDDDAAGNLDRFCASRRWAPPRLRSAQKDSLAVGESGRLHRRRSSVGMAASSASEVSRLDNTAHRASITASMSPRAAAVETAWRWRVVLSSQSHSVAWTVPAPRCWHSPRRREDEEAKRAVGLRRKRPRRMGLMHGRAHHGRRVETLSSRCRSTGREMTLMGGRARHRALRLRTRMVRAAGEGQWLGVTHHMPRAAGRLRLPSGAGAGTSAPTCGSNSLHRALAAARCSPELASSSAGLGAAGQHRDQLPAEAERCRPSTHLRCPARLWGCGCGQAWPLASRAAQAAAHLRLGHCRVELVEPGGGRPCRIESTRTTSYVERGGPEDALRTGRMTCRRHRMPRFRPRVASLAQGVEPRRAGAHQMPALRAVRAPIRMLLESLRAHRRTLCASREIGGGQHVHHALRLCAA